MLRKYIAFLMIALSAVISANAQSAVGSWYSYPVFTGTIDQIIDGKSKVFFTTANRLYSFDKTSNEMYSWSPANSLNDTEVSKIYYNPDRGYLLVTYDTSNIDVIDEVTGRVINLGDIKSSGLNVSKNINDVAFGDGRIYVATDFGMVVYNEKNFQVIESGIYNTQVKYIAESDGLVVMNIGAKLLVAPVDIRHNTLEKFTEVHSSLGISSMDAINGGVLAYFNYGKSLYKFLIDPVTLKLTVAASINVTLDTNRPIKNLNNEYVVQSNGNMIIIDANGDVVETVAMPEQLKNQILAMGRGPESVWGADTYGLANYSVSEYGDVTVLSDKAMPQGTMSVSIPASMAVSNDGIIYIINYGWTGLRSHGGNLNTPGYINKFVNGEAQDVTPHGIIYNNSFMKSQQGKLDIPVSLSAVTTDPTTPSRYAVACSAEHIWVFKDGEIEHDFTLDNAPFEKTSWLSGIMTDIKFDSKGNLWVLMCMDKQYDTLIMLPADKINGSVPVTIDDWKIVDGFKANDARGGVSGMLCMSSKYPRFGFLSYNWYANKVGVVDTETLQYKVLSPVIDQDGKTVTFEHILSMCEDKNGKIWMGTASGLFEIANPSQVMNADFRVNRLKVPRNDGTNYADYLLDSETVNCIAVDGVNRKWIGTENSGLYLVSENGDEIIANYTVDNSDIPSNTIYSVICDPNSNLVYVGTRNGLATFGSTSAPSAPSFTDIYAYPNPVKPGYTGYITVRGLMDDSLVKIADSAGNVVHQGRSNGGMFVWDGNNLSGQRVSSGVYYVFASQNANDSASAAVTKIVVIN